MKIVIHRTDNCLACKVMTENVIEAVNNVNADVDIQIRNNSNLKEYPTVIFIDNDKEVARLVGTYPVPYLESILEKL